MEIERLSARSIKLNGEAGVLPKLGQLRSTTIKVLIQLQDNLGSAAKLTVAEALLDP